MSPVPCSIPTADPRCSVPRGAEHGRASQPMVSRRGFLTTAAASGIATGASFAPRPVWAKTTMTPDEALAELKAGNDRFADVRLASFEQDLTILRQHTVAKQEPFAAVLSCIDSRVPVELVFDQSIGHLVVARVAGNICTPEVIASLEYGAEVLGTVAIMVLGHADCGAVKATIAGKAVPGQISALYAPLRPAVERAGPDPDKVARENALIQANLLSTASPVIAGLVKSGKLKVVAGFFELASGRVTML
jgi:carbonic anhydrase